MRKPLMINGHTAGYWALSKERDILIRENNRLREKVLILDEKLEAIEKERQSEINYPEYVEELKLKLAEVTGQRDAYESVYNDLLKLLI